MERIDLARIKQSPLFQTISAEEISRLFEHNSIALVTFAKGELIVHRGEPCESLYVLLEGELTAQISTFDGRTMIVEHLCAPDVIASAMLFADENTYPVDVRALTRSRILKAPRSTVYMMCVRFPQFLRVLLNDMGNRARFLSERLRLSRFASIEQKIAAYLYERSEGFSRPTLVLERSVRELSELFGVTRPSLSRVFGTLREREILRLDDSTITIIDKTELKRIYEEAR